MSVVKNNQNNNILNLKDQPLPHRYEMTTEQTIEQKPPFNIGDLVILRAKDAKLQKYKHLPSNDLGVVIDIKPSKNTRWSYTENKIVQDTKWHVWVEWQQYEPRSGTFKCFHTRLKKVR